jgi:hypothetical protein
MTRISIIPVFGVLLALSLQAADDPKPDTKKQDFTITQLASPAITLSLAKPVPMHVAFALIPALQYKVSGTNRYENLLIGTEWEAQEKSGDSKIMRMACFVPTAVKDSSGELWTTSWRMFTGTTLQNSVKGKGTVRVALFEAIPGGSGGKADFKYGRQVSNAIEMLVQVTRY